MNARLARFYGWTDREIGQTSWRRLLAYMEQVGPLTAEEQLAAVNVAHGKPQEMSRKLRAQIGARRGQKVSQKVITEWATNPYTASGIEFVEQIPTPS